MTKKNSQAERDQHEAFDKKNSIYANGYQHGFERGLQRAIELVASDQAREYDADMHTEITSDWQRGYNAGAEFISKVTVDNIKRELDK